jgi:hypothetical protein
VGPRAVLEALVKRKIPSPRWQSNARTPIIQRYTDGAIMALIKTKKNLKRNLQAALLSILYLFH